MAEELAVFPLRVSSRLKDRIVQECDREGVPMNELIARVMADYFKKPDLAKIPRKPLGRRKRLADAS